MIDSYSGYASGSNYGTGGTTNNANSNTGNYGNASVQSSDSYSQTSGISQSEAEAFVTGLYAYHLGRSPDEGGLAFWAGALVDGVTVKAMGSQDSSNPPA